MMVLIQLHVKPCIYNDVTIASAKICRIHACIVDRNTVWEMLLLGSYQVLSFLSLLSKLSSLSFSRTSTERFPSTSWAEEKLVMTRVGIPRQRSTVKVTDIRAVLCLCAKFSSYNSYLTFSRKQSVHLKCSNPLKPLRMMPLVQLWKSYLCMRFLQTPSTGHIWLPSSQLFSTVGGLAHCQSIDMVQHHQNTAAPSDLSTHPCHHLSSPGQTEKNMLNDSVYIDHM